MKTISRIAYRNDKKNRTRSILIMMAICLTTMLLVIISTVGNGMIRLQKSQAAGSYGSNYGLFVSADGSQLKEVNRRAEIDATGTMCTEGIIKGNEKGGFVCMDETARKMLPYNKEYELKEGKYPGGTQEIAAGRAFFRAMGYDDVKIGDTVTLDTAQGCSQNISRKNLLSAESYMIGMSIPSRHLMLLSGHRSFMMSTSQRMTDSIIFILL
ncbi:hypothetical protein [Faecalibacillus intestinalis]|uniref:hypothetical protein n=1 Tax=Faecalibacillus intestinalis TaxID=1982626 RepID=UPI0022E656E1|nr:hypothetical protein [Faecalibacillus intestinalis]